MAKSLFFSNDRFGMMVEMARIPPNLDNLMNEGIAFVIDRFKSELPHCPRPLDNAPSRLAGGRPHTTHSTKC